MLKILFSVFMGILGAALLHMVIILSLPRFSDRDADTKIRMLGAAEQFHPIDASSPAGLSNGDPYMHTAVCAFDIADTPIRLTAAGKVPFWSLAVYDADSNEVFSMSDRTSVGGMLDVLVASPIQMTAIRKALPSELSQSILAEMNAPEGYAVLRSMAPQASFDPAAQAFLASAGCAAFDAD